MFAAVENIHSQAASGHDQVFDLHLAAQLAGSNLELVLAFKFHIQNVLQFAEVGFEDIHTPILPEIPMFGVHGYRDAQTRRQLQSPGDHLSGQHPLVVIFNDQRLAVGKQPAQAVKESCPCFVSQVNLGLAVDAYDLLVCCHDPGLQSCLSVRIGDQTISCQSFALHQLFQVLRRAVSAGHAKQDGFSAQGFYVQRCVCGSTQAELLFLNFQDRHGRFGGNALHLAPDVMIQHDVAQNENALSAKLGQKLPDHDFSRGYWPLKQA